MRPISHQRPSLCLLLCHCSCAGTGAHSTHCEPLARQENARQISILPAAPVQVTASINHSTIQQVWGPSQWPSQRPALAWGDAAGVDLGLNSSGLVTVETMGFVEQSFREDPLLMGDLNTLSFPQRSQSRPGSGWATLADGLCLRGFFSSGSELWQQCCLVVAVPLLAC